MGRIIALDYGRKRIGIAKTDPMQMLALPHKVLLSSKELKDTITLLLKELSLLGPIDTIVIGLPLEMRGTEGEMAKEVKTFAEALKAMTSIPLVFWDERLTSCQAERLLKEHEYSRKQRTSLSDTTAACILLGSFLASKRG